jgi:serine/threonine-protein kinase
MNWQACPLDVVEFFEVSEPLDVTKLPEDKVLLDKYRVIQTLGVGGMGAVVAAEHLQLGSKVAIKFLLPSLVDNESVVKRFLQEAKAATRIHSEHVARVVDVGELTGEGLPEQGVPFMVMEYLEGRDLSEWVKMGKKFPVEDAIDYVIQAGEAIAQAHKQGIIHRDVKPANLFLCERDDRKLVKVLDFGISKLMEEGPEDMGLTKTTTVLGSGLYMSPEQMRSAKKVDFRTDIYSLGVCLYELLTGTQPHTAETFSELCVKVNVDPPTPLRDYRPDISEELAEVIAVAYERKPEDRYQAVQEFVAALAPYAGRTSKSKIEQVQGITRHESMVPPPPANPQLKSTAAAVTAEALPKERPGSKMGLVVAAFGAVLIAGVVGLFVVRQQQETSAPAGTGPEPSETTSATPAPPPSETASATPSAAPSIVPSASPSASASASATPTATSVAQPPPRATPKPPPSPKPPPVVVPKPPPCKPAIDPETGLMNPCP